MGSMNLGEPLSAYTLVRSSRFDAVEAEIAARFRRIILRPRDRDRNPLRFSHAPLPGSRMSLGYFNCGSAMRLTTTDPLDFLPVIIPLSGSADFHCGPERFEADQTCAIVPGVDDPLDMRTSAGWSQLIFRLERDAVEGRLASLLGRPLDQPLQFARKLSLQDGPAAALRIQARAMLADLSSESSLLARGINTREMQELISTTLLYAHRHNYSDEMAQPPKVDGPHYVRLAKALLDERYLEQLSITQISDDLGISLRSLNRAFRAKIGVTPREYLLNLRLDAVRRELAKRLPGAKVTTIAMRYHFGHLGRFSALYRKRFGENPSVTLHGQRL